MTEDRLEECEQWLQHGEDLVALQIVGELTTEVRRLYDALRLSWRKIHTLSNQREEALDEVRRLQRENAQLRQVNDGLMEITSASLSPRRRP